MTRTCKKEAVKSWMQRGEKKVMGNETATCKAGRRRFFRLENFLPVCQSGGIGSLAVPPAMYILSRSLMHFFLQSSHKREKMLLCVPLSWRVSSLSREWAGAAVKAAECSERIIMEIANEPWRDNDPSSRINCKRQVKIKQLKLQWNRRKGPTAIKILQNLGTFFY